MQAVHFRAEGIHDENEAAFIEMIVRLVDGVKDVASIRSLHLISVLYDERVASVRQIMKTVRSAGFRAKRYQPRRRLASPASSPVSPA